MLKFTRLELVNMKINVKANTSCVSKEDLEEKMISRLRPRLNIERSLVYVKPCGMLRGYVCVCFELRKRYDFNWFVASLD